MATPPNINAPSGLTPVKQTGGGVLRPNESADYAIAGGLASNIYRGDLVKPTGTGTNIDIVAAGASNPSIGSFKGVNYIDAGGNVQFRPYWGSGQTVLSGSTPEATVWDNPDILFDAQVSGTGLLATNIGNTCNLNTSVAGSTLTGTSGEQADQASLSNSLATQQLQIQSLRLSTNNNYGQFARALVSIFLHYKGAVAGGGVVY